VRGIGFSVCGLGLVGRGLTRRVGDERVRPFWGAVLRTSQSPVSVSGMLRVKSLYTYRE
jgi:hypothetical protein